MKKTLFLLIVASLLSFAGCEKEIVKSDDGFSVSRTKQVRFAKGNLVYDEDDGYRFAAHQYDYGGLFGWGTGGNPTLTSEDYGDYSTFDDWGNYIDGGWRTLKIKEWQYLIWNRADASAKWGLATVCGVCGVVLLPDSWSGGAFNAGNENGYRTNEYDASSWADMEASNAIFLPAAGDRYGICGDGYYWTSSSYGQNNASVMNFSSDHLFVTSTFARYQGFSVRLVQDVK